VLFVTVSKARRQWARGIHVSHATARFPFRRLQISFDAFGLIAR
jgi:hypothetical protein